MISAVDDVKLVAAGEAALEEAFASIW